MKSLLVLAIMLAPALASAQGYYGGGGGGYYSQPPPTLPGGFHDRQGRLAWGFSIGIGGMHDGGSKITSCNSCDYNPAAIEVDGHIGGFIGPRFALMGEAQVNAQTVAVDTNGTNGDIVLSQNVLMIAGQFWLTPQLWVKGGIGLAHLEADDNYFQYGSADGGAIMGGVGYELMSARNFAVDLQGRLVEGSYHGLNDHVTSGTVGVGINWY